jgi:hypothetical protein
MLQQQHKKEKREMADPAIGVEAGHAESMQAVPLTRPQRFLINPSMPAQHST